MINYTEFKETLLTMVKERLGESVEVCLESRRKTNSVEIDAITIREEDRRIMPSIHIRGFYERYQDTEDMEEIVDAIEEIVAIRDILPEEVELDNWEYMKEKVLMKAINYDWNQEYLQKVPHQKLLDLALVCYAKINTREEDRGEIVVTEELLKIWGTTEEELFTVAINNLTREKFKVVNMKEVMNEILGIENDEAENCPMFVLRNESGVFGAIGIIFKEKLEEFGKYVGDFYILPSSVHELMLLPEFIVDDAEQMKSFVESTNQMYVCPMERLSNNVYRYNCESGEIEVM